MGQVDVWHTGVLAPSEVISDHYLSFNVSPQKQNISTFLKSTPRISSRQKKVTFFSPACFKLFTNCFLTKVIPLQPYNFILHVLISNLFENGATTRKPVTQVLIFPALVFFIVCRLLSESHQILHCPFVYARCQYFACMHCDGCCATACRLCVVVLSVSLSPVISICLCYVCHYFSFLRSTHKSSCSVSFTYSMLDVWHECWFVVLCLWCIGFCVCMCVCYLHILDRILVLPLCCVRLIWPPSPVLSLHYGFGRSHVIKWHDRAGDLSFLTSP